MSQDDKDRLREERRRKLIGRLAVIGLLLLVIAYLVPIVVRPH